MHTSVSELVDAVASQIDRLLEHSSIKPGGMEGSDLVFFFRKPTWKPLPAAGLRSQSTAKQALRELEALVEALFHDDTRLNDVRELKDQLLRAVNQNEEATGQDILSARQKAAEAIQEIRSRFDDLAAGDQAGVFLITDTNALYWNPDLQDWAFEGLSRFTLVLPAQVFSELDEHKDRHKNRVIQKKAAGLIRRIEEYRRRGRIIDGVTLRKDRSEIMALPLAPDMNRSLKWLRAERPDDQILASAIEVSRTRFASHVAIVTRDTGLRNKCELARVGSLEPPAPRRRDDDTVE